MRNQERFKIIFLKGTWELSCQEYLSHTRIAHGQAQTSESVRPWPKHVYGSCNDDMYTIMRFLFVSFRWAKGHLSTLETHLVQQPTLSCFSVRYKFINLSTQWIVMLFFPNMLLRRFFQYDLLYVFERCFGVGTSNPLFVSTIETRHFFFKTFTMGFKVWNCPRGTAMCCFVPWHYDRKKATVFSDWFKGFGRCW